MAGAYERALRRAADLACDKCAEFAGQRLKTLSGGRQAFYGNVDLDACRFSVGVVEKYEYLVYQDRGFATFVMKELRGKTIPMYLDGVLVFRKASRINEWRPGAKTYWRRGADGKLLPYEEQRRSWVHPGLPSKDFIRDGVTAAAEESASDIYAALVADIEEGGGLL